ncbi:MAG: dephospho-CoA kinase [Oscillospiraceae bacterium]|nr:dephospho-CoA kinase [Oscillospiraceae bacterium]
MTIIGITGGTGCGKTTALNTLSELGALILDCDEIYHELTVSDADMRRELTERFGDVYDGTALNRKRLGSVVFADAEALRALGEITHKYVRREVGARLARHERGGGTLAAIDAIALLEGELKKLCSFTVGVTAPREVRIQRIMARDGIDRAYAEKRVDAQKPNEYFERGCTYTLSNDGDLPSFQDKCKKFFTEVLKNV